MQKRQFSPEQISSILKENDKGVVYYKYVVFHLTIRL